ncbi:MAG TPA: hypothetical protein VMT38_08440 [Terracidiphilus sp.]|nr:hypothetical protein [Terracidiphilus sp.]
MKFQSVQRDEVPRGRAGKHSRIVTLLLNHLERLPSGNALKVPLSDLPDSKARIRSALNRATHRKGLAVATSSDSSHLYLWKAGEKS